mmetsp:Transcript_9926/g.22814  ORF Transcript_9926/g.22814 Transcript_9926/m.22814 type:complete len:504 (-) Transcript_9926:1962-3473(-)
MRRRGSRFMSWKRTKSPSPEAIEETSATASTSSTSSAQEAPPAPETETETETESPPPDPPPPPNTMAGDDSDRLSKVEKTLDKVVGMLDILMNQPQQQQRHDSDSPTVSKPDSPKRHGSTRITSGPHGGDHHHHHRSGDQKDEELLLDDDASWEGSAAGASKKGSFLEGDPNSDNEDSVKVIDTDAIEKKAVLNESDAWKINPKNKFRMGWDLFLIMPFLIYMTIAMPFRLCFANDPIIFTPMYWFEFMIDMMFILDMIFNFMTGYYVELEGSEEDLVEYDLCSIAVRYLKTWFLLDLVSGIPFALIELMSGGGSGAGAFKGAKVLKLLRFLKLGRLLKVEKILSNLDRDTLDRLEDFLQDQETRSAILLANLGCFMGFVCHLLACGFVVVGRQGAIDGKPNWLENDPVKGPWGPADTGPDREAGSIYIVAFYFCLTTMTSVGYGDVLPMSDRERIYVIVLEFVGAIVFGLTIALLTSVLGSTGSFSRPPPFSLVAAGKLRRF